MSSSLVLPSDPLLLPSLALELDAVILPSTFCYDEDEYFQVSLRPSCGSYSIEIALILFRKSRILFSPDQFEKFKKMLSTSDCCDSSMVGNYIVSFYSEKITFLRKNEHYGVGIKQMRKFISRISAAIDYKVSFLEKYRAYASLVHGRIVNFYVDKLRNSDNVDYFVHEFVKTDLINLDSNALPRNYDDEICDYSALDFTVCYLINSEIRLNLSNVIYIDSLTRYITEIFE